jgi:hypothetical protein
MTALLSRRLLAALALFLPLTAHAADPVRLGLLHTLSPRRSIWRRRVAISAMRAST